MNRQRVTQIALSILLMPVIVGVTMGVGGAFYSSTQGGVVSAQSPETPTEPEQPATESPESPEAPAEPAEPAEPEQPAAESPAEPSAPAEAAEVASDTNWLLIGGGILAVLVIIAIISSLSGRRRHDV